jgi:hypothetical protein
MTEQEHLENLIRHIDLVRGACLLLGRRLIARGQAEFGRILIARGFLHDSSKFFGIEWEYLHAGRDVPEEALRLAIRQHTLTNPHHPEYWGGFAHMPEISVAEMVCDWFARSQEFGTDLRNWIETVAVPRFGMDRASERYRWVRQYVELLLEPPLQGPAR